MFSFKQFTIHQDRCAMKVGTDGVLIGAWAQGGRNILDVGTGTGIIALMMAQRFPNARVSAIELDGAAAQQARENVLASPFAARMKVMHAALQKYNGRLFDAIVANPPFFTHSFAAKGVARTMARQTENLSFRDLCQHGRRLLADNGVMSIILPADRFGEIEAEAAIAGLSPHRRTWVRTTENKTPRRCLLAYGITPVNHFQEETCTIMIRGEHTPWYRSLVEDFYL